MKINCTFTVSLVLEDAQDLKTHNEKEVSAVKENAPRRAESLLREAVQDLKLHDVDYEDRIEGHSPESIACGQPLA